MTLEQRIKHAVELFVGKGCIQHKPEVTDGKQGNIHYFEPMQTEYPYKSIAFVRCINKGDLVAHQTHQTSPDNHQYIQIDFFTFDTYSKIAEH